MDTKKLVEQARARFKHHESKLYLQEKYSNKLTLANQGGMWTITPEFIGFLKTAREQVVILDNFKNPVRVNSAELLSVAEDTYYTIMDQWSTEHFEAKRNR